MALLEAETKSKLLVLCIIIGCVCAAILLGIVIFELPWRTNDIVRKEEISELSYLVSDDSVELLKQKWVRDDLTSLEKANALLDLFPVVDGHNDFPWNLRKFVQNDLRKVNFSEDLTKVEPWGSYNETHTDLNRLREGHVGGQFWVAYTDCESQGKDSVAQTLEQIDVIHRLIEEYPEDLEFCDNSKCILKARQQKKIASLIGIEGGHSIGSSPGILRQMYKLGARYLTITHSCNTAFADASPVDRKENPLQSLNHGLSHFGVELIHEMNRIGMMIDLSHVSHETMRNALERSRAPVIFSHSCTKAICNHHRNVADDILQLLKVNRGIIMVNLYSKFVQCDESKNATIEDVIAHLNHIRNLIGTDYIGIGGDYDGVDSLPHGLEDVSTYPKLFARLIDHGWEIDDLRKLAFENIIRVMSQVELVAKTSKEDHGQLPMQSIISMGELKSKGFSSYDTCSSHKSLSNLVESSKRRRDQEKI